MTSMEEVEVVHQHPIKNGFWYMPKMFYAVFFIEFWERFAFYGLQSIAVLFFIQKFGLEESHAVNLFSSFSALLYAFLIIGGYLGDKILGLRRTYLLGMVFLMVGYGSFAFINDVSLLYWSMGMVLVGNIFFKTNAGNYVNRCFKPNDPRLDSAFTYFYMSINMGSFFSMILIPFVAEKTSYSFSIGLCGLGMLIALASYYLLQDRFVKGDNEIGGNPTNKTALMATISCAGVAFAYALGLLLTNPAMSNMILFGFSTIVFAIFFLVRAKLSQSEQKGMFLAFILLIQSIFFWLMYMQMATSLTLFAVHNVRTTILGISIPPEVTQSFNPFYIFLLSPILAWLYTRSEERKKPISIPGKFAFGMFVCGVAYLLLGASCFLHDDMGTISLLWLFIGYGLYSLGELLISAIGLSMVSKLMPLQLGGFAQAMWFVTSGIGMKLGGMAAGFGTIDPSVNASNFEILHSYQILFFAIGAVATLFSFLLFAFVKSLANNINTVMVQKKTQ